MNETVRLGSITFERVDRGERYLGLGDRIGTVLPDGEVVYGKIVDFVGHYGGTMSPSSVIEIESPPEREGQLLQIVGPRPVLGEVVSGNE